jgi:hypothetical protein
LSHLPTKCQDLSVKARNLIEEQLQRVGLLFLFVDCGIRALRYGGVGLHRLLLTAHLHGQCTNKQYKCHE